MRWNRAMARQTLYRVVCLFGILVPLTMAGCSAQDQAGNPTPGISETEIVIGSSSALTGHAGFLGTQYSRGADAHFADINERGGIHGRKIRVISLDDQYDPPQTILNTQRLIEDDRVFMLFGYVGTPTSVQVIDLVHTTGTPAFGFLTGAEELRTPLRPYMFHVRSSYFAEAEAAIAYFVDHLGLDRIAVVYQDDAFGYAVLTGVQLALQRRSLEIQSTAAIPRGSMEVEATAAVIAEGEPEAVFMVGTYSPLAKFINKCHHLGLSPYFSTVSFVGSEAFARELIDVQGVSPASYEKIIVTQVVPSPYSDNFSAVNRYRESFGRRYPDDPLNYVALEGHINASILTGVLEAAGPKLDRKALLVALEGVKDYDSGIAQLITFGPFDRRGLTEVYYSRLSAEGLFRTYTP